MTRRNSAIIRALTNRIRVDILMALKNGEKHVSRLCEDLQCEQSAVSHALRRLLADKLVRVRQDGSFRYYALVSNSVLSLLETADILQRPAGQDPFTRRDSLGEAVLREKGTQLTAILRHTPISLATVDKNGMFLSVVGHMLGRHGLKQDFWLGKSIFEMYGGNKEVVGAINGALRGETMKWMMAGGEDEQEFAYDLTALPEHNATGEIDKVLVVIVDVLDRERLRRLCS